MLQKSQLSPDALYRRLEKRLLGQEVAFFPSLRHEFRHIIKWKDLADLGVNILESLLKSLFSRLDKRSKHSSLSWIREEPHKGLLYLEAKFLDDPARGALRQRYLGLLLLQKLLGTMKQEVQRRIEEISPLRIDAEVQIVCDLSEALNISPVEAKDMVMQGKTPETKPEIPELPSSERIKGGILVRGKIETKPRTACPHIRKEILYRNTSGKRITITRCSSCKLELSALISAGAETKCTHRSAAWVSGKEGREAACTTCKEIVPNPETFQWSVAGLEPYGDDPSTDQVINLEEAMNHAATNC